METGTFWINLFTCLGRCTFNCVTHLSDCRIKLCFANTILITACNPLTATTELSSCYVLIVRTTIHKQGGFLNQIQAIRNEQLKGHLAPLMSYSLLVASCRQFIFSAFQCRRDDHSMSSLLLVELPSLLSIFVAAATTQQRCRNFFSHSESSTLLILVSAAMMLQKKKKKKHILSFLRAQQPYWIFTSLPAEPMKSQKKKSIMNVVSVILLACKNWLMYCYQHYAAVSVRVCK